MASAVDGDANLTGETPILEILSGAPQFRPPSQVRSHEKTHAILDAADALLRERPYASIRMQDVADKAGCAVTAIYARFADKDGLLSAIHMVKLQEVRVMLADALRPENLSCPALRGVAAAFVRINEFYFTENANLTFAQFTSGSGEAFRATAEILDAYAQRLARATAAVCECDEEALMGPLKFAIQTVLSIYWGHGLAADYFNRPSPAALTSLFLYIVEHRLTA